MLSNPRDSASRWWFNGSNDSDGYACASSTADFSSLKKPIALMLKDNKRPRIEAAHREWAESGSSLEDEGRAFAIASGSRTLFLYQPRKTETNQIQSLDLVVCFPNAGAIQDIRIEKQSVYPNMEIHQGTPLVVVGVDNAWGVRIRATHPDLRRIPLRFEESEEGLLLVLHLMDFGRPRQLKDEELPRYSALVTTEEKKLNNPRALEGFEHDLGNQEIWDDFSDQVLRRAGFIGNGFKLTGTLNQLEEEWVDRFVIGP